VSFKSIIRIVLLIFVVGSVSFLIAKEYGFDSFKNEVPLPASNETAAAPAPRAAEDEGDGVVLYYFHGYRRCFTCRTIEKYLAEEMEADFAAGPLEWRPVNVEEPGNQHFIRDFGLVSSTALIAEMKGGSIERSKKLDLVWRLVKDEAAFKEYVRNEILSFMEGGSGR